MLLKCIDERSKIKKATWGKGVMNAMRSTDSEASAIYVLQQTYVIDNIIEDLREKMDKLDIPEGTSWPQIVSIEFHGCTTRDMCPLCFSNMNIIQYLCNNRKEDSFLGYLRQKLTTIENPKNRIAYAVDECSTKMFISSTRKDEGNLNFSDDSSPEIDNCIHQFRILRKPLKSVKPGDKK